MRQSPQKSWVGPILGGSTVITGSEGVALIGGSLMEGEMDPP